MTSSLETERAILKVKVNKKGKYEQEKKASYKKQVITETNMHTIYTAHNIFGLATKFWCYILSRDVKITCKYIPIPKANVQKTDNHTQCRSSYAPTAGKHAL